MYHTDTCTLDIRYQISLYKEHCIAEFYQYNFDSLYSRFIILHLMQFAHKHTAFCGGPNFVLANVEEFFVLFYTNDSSPFYNIFTNSEKKRS
jgi:hypothetical protein